MKRFLCILLIASAIMSGCQTSGERIKEPVTFYYVKSNYQRELTNAFLSEQREASGHRDDLSYLMALYLMGPIDENLTSPIPAGTRIYIQESNAYNVKLKLSDTEKTLSDAEFSVASACLAMTCLELTGTQTVTVSSGSRSVTMTSGNLELTDTNMAIALEVT